MFDINFLFRSLCVVNIDDRADVFVEFFHFLMCVFVFVDFSIQNAKAKGKGIAYFRFIRETRRIAD